ncbi:MAG: VOC family protein [Pirellulaceae bacterium]|nr:VOC family protein [Pirellulaceae bacterium]
MKTACPQKFLSRRVFLSSLGALTLTPRMFASEPTSDAIPVTAINHVMINVSDLARSLDWYQRLFGMSVVARQKQTIILRVGNGPQFLEMASRARAKPGITHFGLAIDNFDPDRIVDILEAHEITVAQKPAPMKAHVRIREQAIGGTPEVYVGDPDGIVIQLNDSSYGGGAGPLGDKYSRAPESAPADGLLAVRDYNHVTSFVPDQRRTVRFYQKLFQMPIDTYQGPLPILRVGTGNQSLAFVGAADRQSPALIDHVCFAMDDFNPGRILATLAGYGVAPRADERRRPAPLKSYVTMRMPDRGGAPGGTPELYFTDPDGILLQVQDMRYCCGGGYLGDERGTPKGVRK